MTARLDIDTTPRAARTFVVPGEPHAWERARAQVIRGSVKFFTSEAMREKQRDVILAARRAGISPANGPLGLDVVGSWLFPRSLSQSKIVAHLERLHGDATLLVPKFTRPDADNIGKLVADALNEVAYLDDGQIWLVRSATCWGPRAETHVRIWYGDRPPQFPHRWWDDASPEDHDAAA